MGRREKRSREEGGGREKDNAVDGALSWQSQGAIELKASRTFHGAMCTEWLPGRDEVTS